MDAREGARDRALWRRCDRVARSCCEAPWTRAKARGTWPVASR